MVSGSVDSGCHKLSENVWFVWSKTSYSGDKWRCHRCGTDGRTDEQTTSKDRATQLLICEPLSLATTTTMKTWRASLTCASDHPGSLDSHTRSLRVVSSLVSLSPPALWRVNIMNFNIKDNNKNNTPSLRVALSSTFLSPPALPAL